MEKWHKIGQIGMVCVDTETQRVLRATKTDRNGSLIPASVYKWSKVYRSWIQTPNIKLKTLQSGVSRGTHTIE